MAIVQLYIGIIISLAIAAGACICKCISYFKTFVAFFTTPVEAVGDVITKNGNQWLETII
jgi:hypothetical protein|tara:strand:- start:490 stop:669 length:180 start_codon:yes stop_codon:yes gene_type:complete